MSIGADVAQAEPACCRDQVENKTLSAP